MQIIQHLQTNSKMLDIDQYCPQFHIFLLICRSQTQGNKVIAKKPKLRLKKSISKYLQLRSKRYRSYPDGSCANFGQGIAFIDLSEIQFLQNSFKTENFSFIYNTIIQNTQMFSQGNSNSMKSNQGAILPTEALIARATYAPIKENRLPMSQIIIFSKTGNSSKYRQYIPGTLKKNSFPGKFRKNIAKKKKNESDDDYNVKNQKKDRNVTSNLIHHLIKFLTVTRGQQEFTRGIIAYQKLNITYQEFFAQLQILGKNLKTYVTLKHIQELWFSQRPQKQEFCFIMRALSKIFYKKNGFSSVFHSNKFNIASKNVHYKGIRNLVDVLIRKDLEKLRSSLISS